jgi:hypothetical protein
MKIEFDEKAINSFPNDQELGEYVRDMLNQYKKFYERNSVITQEPIKWTTITTDPIIEWDHNSNKI